MRPVGNTSRRPRDGEPLGPGGTKRPSRPRRAAAGVLRCRKRSRRRAESPLRRLSTGDVDRPCVRVSPAIRAASSPAVRGARACRRDAPCGIGRRRATRRDAGPVHGAPSSHRADRSLAELEVAWRARGPARLAFAPCPSPTGKRAKREQRIAPLSALRRRAERVQAVANLRFLQFAEVGVGAREERVVVGGFEPSSSCEPSVDDAFEDRLTQQLRAARIDHQRLVVFVDLPLRGPATARSFPRA